MYIVGVDGGQSSTLALVANSKGKIIGSATAGPANHIHEPGGPERCRRALTDAIGGALKAAGVAAADVAGVGMGMTGARPLMQAIAQEVLKTLGCAAPLNFAHDAVSTLEGALGGEPGCIVISGTGSVALARDASGREKQTGGWGYLFGDEGSGWWIGVELLRAASRQADGRDPRGLLLKAVLRHFSVTRIEELHLRVYSGEVDRPQIAGLAKLADQLAKEGDPSACAILDRASEALVELAVSALKHVDLPHPLVSYAGGVWKSDRVLANFTKGITQLVPGANVVAPLMSPAGGALLLGFKAANISPTSEVRRALAEQLKESEKS